MMINAKMNEKGKLLAIIAVFAMVFAGAAVVMSSEGVDADAAAYEPTAVPDTAVELPTSIAAATDVPTGNTYYAAKNTTTTLSYATETAIIVYVKSGVFVEFKGATGNQVTVTVFGYYEVDNAKKYNGGNPDTHDTNVAIGKLVADENIKVTPTTVAAKHTTMGISGTATTTANLITITLGNGVPATVGAYGTAAVTVKGTLTLNGAAAPANLTYAYSLTDGSATTIAIYETAKKTYAHEVTDDANDVLTIAGYDGLKVTASIKVTSDMGTTTFNLDNAILTENLTVKMSKPDEPVLGGGAADTIVTLEKGFAVKDINDTSRFKGLINGVAKAAEDPAEDPTDFYAQLYYKETTTGETTTADSYLYVTGTVTQKSNVTIGTGALIVDEGWTLIVPENVTITLLKSTKLTTTPIAAPTATIDGTVVLQGSLVNKSEGNAAFVAGTSQLQIGPLGFTNFATTAATINVASTGKAFEINQDVIEDTTVGSAVIGSAGITIPAGHSLTVNGDLGLNGHKLTVNGKLIVTGSVYSTATAPGEVTITTTEAGTIAKNVIIVGATGDVDIAKDMAVNTYVGLILDTETDKVDVILRGVDGLVYTAVDYKDVATPAISGEVVANTLSNENVKPEVILNDAATVIPLPLTISSGVTLDVQGEKIVAGGLALIEIVGALVKSTDGVGTLELESFSSIHIDGMIENVKIVAFEGVVPEKGEGELNTTFEFTVAHTSTGTTAGPYKKTFVTGLQMIVLHEAISKTVTLQHVYIEGDLATTSVNVDKAPATGAATTPVVKVTGTRLHVDEDAALSIPAASKLTFDIPAELVMVVEGYIAKADSALGCNYIGGHYVTETKESGTTKTTHIYEPFAKAIAVIDSAKNKTVDACISKFDFNFNITDGQTLNLVTPALNEDKIQIDSEAMIIIENGGKQTGVAFNDIQGVLVQQNGATIVTPDEDAYAAKTVNEETGDVTYSGLIPAIKLSVPGSVITILNGKADGNLVIPAQRTVIVEGQVELYGDLTVEEGAIITGGDFIFVSEKATTHNLRVEGIMDADEGSITHSDTSKIAATVTGVLFITSDQVISQFDSFTGAGWETATGYALSTIDEAVVGAVAAGISEDVTIFGNVVWVADIEISKVVIIFNDDKAALNFAGTVTLDDATINVDKGTFTGTVTASTTLLGSATVEFTAVKGTLKITEDNGLTLSDKLDDGIVSLESGVTIFGGLTMGDALLMVGERATAHVHGETKITDGVFTIAGTVAADNGGRLALEGGINMVAATGTLAAQRTATPGNVDIKTLTVYGTLKEDGGVITITANAGENSGLIIGDEPSSLGAANGTVIGNITTGTGKVIMIYAGADFDEMKIDGATTYKATVFMINGVEYQYLVSSGAEDVTADLLAASDYDLPGYDGTAALKTIGGWDFGTASPKVGTPALVTATLEKSTVDVTISPIKGMSIVVDGVTYKNTTEAELKVGEHTLSYTLDPGYKIKDGSSVTMTFNGVKVTNSIIITPGMVGQDLILAASGEIVIDQEIPEQEKQDDTVIIILLAILVVMVVILAIVTILRMMRS